MPDTPASIQPIEPVVDDPNPAIVPEPAPAPPPEPVEDDRPAPRTLAEERANRLKAIADRIKKDERSNDPEFSGDIIAAQNASLPPPETPPGTVPPAEPTPPQAPPSAGPSDSQPKKRTLKVRGKDVEMTEAEIIAQAQKALAADSYFEDGRRFYEEADRARKGARAQHPDARAQEPDFVPEPSADDNTPADPLVKALEQHAYGEDPAETAKIIRSVIQKEVGAGSQQAVVKQRMADDLAQTFQAFEKIKAEEPDLIKDKATEGALQAILHDAYAEDLRAIGIPDERIPQHPGERVDWHRYYRVTGHSVRGPEKLLRDVKDTFVSWRGGPAKPSSTQPATTPAVQVDRSARLAAVPAAPSRSAAPPRIADTAPSQKSREQIKAEMRDQRKAGYGRRSA